MATPTRVLILGGGYVAINATAGLRQAIRGGSADVTVVSRHNYHVFHGFVSEMLTGRIAPGQILSPVRRVFSPARMHVGEIESVDLDRRIVVTSRHLDGRQHTLPYDHLVLALGTVDNLEAYPGLAEHAFKLKTYDDCFRLRNHLLTMFELADVEDDPAERRQLLTFFVAGGGYAGTEVAGELSDFVRLLTSREYRRIRPEECRVVLVHPGPTILPELYRAGGAAGYGHGHPRLVAYANRHLQRLGVEVRTNTRVTWVSPTEVGLSDGSRIATRTIVSAVGTRPTPLLDTLAVPRDAHGKVQTDRFLRVVGYDNVWAAGDCAAVPHPLGGTCPPVGIYALVEGTCLAENVLRVAAGAAPRAFAYTGLGQAVSIGRRVAVGELKGVEFAGHVCWLLWRALLLRYIPTWDRRIRLLADWLIWPLVGRDIVEMSIADRNDVAIEQEVFETGEVIVAAGDVGRQVYVIIAGDVEVVRGSPQGDQVVTVLGPGGHFGHTSRDRKVRETVRARSQVTVAAVRADQVQRLERVLAPLRGATGNGVATSEVAPAKRARPRAGRRIS